ncbi:MAG: hypothetical protein LBE74_00780, partial [Treponema sp.]|nr:hypothetical protein [Treponema sp.]
MSIESYERTIYVAPDYYRLMVRAMKDVQPLIRRETVHIYSDAETVKTYDLTDADFALSCTLPEPLPAAS